MRRILSRKIFGSVIFAVILIMFLVWFAWRLGLFSRVGFHFFLKTRDVDWAEKQINPHERSVLYKELDLKDFDWLPLPNRFKAQTLAFGFERFPFRAFFLEIDQGRLFLPDQDPVVVTGSLKDNIWGLNVYTSAVSIFNLQRVFPNILDQKLDISLEQVDLFLKGPIEQSRGTGKSFIRKIVYDGFQLSNTQCSIEVTAESVDFLKGISGDVACSGGKAWGDKTAIIDVETVRITFLKNWQDYGVYFKGKTQVEGHKINILITGKTSNPQIKLNSTPSLAENQILLMIATNRGWSLDPEKWQAGQVSSDLAKDFVDYFFFGGRIERVLKRFGIKQVTVSVDKEKTGLTIKKEFSPRIEGTYTVEQNHVVDPNQPQQINTKVTGEYKFNRTLSVEASRELFGVKEESSDPVKSQTDSQILLKYKKSF